jgi:Fur family transcriptional regulator, ferric uptake regulator
LKLKTPFNKQEPTPDGIWNRLQQSLGDRRLRTTAQRRAIVEVFCRAQGHLSIEDILARVRKFEPGVGYATVYRTLKLLSQSGLAHERHFDGIARYEVAAGVHHHDHLICVDCGAITEFEEPRIEALQDHVARKYDFELLRHKHELYGRCARCRNKGRRASRPAGRVN